MKKRSRDEVDRGIYTLRHKVHTYARRWVNKAKQYSRLSRESKPRKNARNRERGSVIRKGQVSEKEEEATREGEKEREKLEAPLKV